MRGVGSLTEGVRQAVRPSLTAGVRAVVATGAEAGGRATAQASARRASDDGTQMRPQATPPRADATPPRMSPIERCRLAHRVADALCAMSDDDRIDLTLTSFGLRRLASLEPAAKSRSARISEVIAEAPDDAIAGLANFLTPPPAAWRDPSLFRLFISHVTKDKDAAMRLRDCLAPLRIAGFVAHEDIHPTLPWQDELHRALLTMDAFLAVHSDGYATSCWAQQEAGFALGRGVKIISFKLSDEAPAGFLAGQQALLRQGRDAEKIAREIRNLLAADEATQARLAFAEAAAGTPLPLVADTPF